MSGRLFAQIERLFEDERRLLLAGQLDRLDRLSRRKERLIAALPDAGLDAGALSRLGAMAQRNEAMLAAARSGIEAAQARLAEIRQGTGIATYSQAGAKSDLRAPRRTLARRA